MLIHTPQMDNSKYLNIFGTFIDFYNIITQQRILNILIFLYLIIGIFGTYCLSTSQKSCQKTHVFKLSLFLIIIYWLHVTLTLIKYLNSSVTKNLTLNWKQKAVDIDSVELQERVFQKAFVKFDQNNDMKIAKDDVLSLIQSLGIYIADEDLSKTMLTINPFDEKYLSYDHMYKWYSSVNTS